MTAYAPRADELSWREVDGEVVLLDERDWSYLHLNATGAVIWKLIAESPRDLDAVVAAVTGEFDIDEPTARSDAQELLDELLAKQLVTAG